MFSDFSLIFGFILSPKFSGRGKTKFFSTYGFAAQSFDQFDLRVGIKGRGVTGIPSSIRDLASSGFASP